MPRAALAPPPKARSQRMRALAAALAFAVLAPAVPAAAQSWPWSWARSGDTAGGGDLAAAAAQVRAMPAQTLAAAADVTPEGHWRFINRAGDVYTAGTPAELKRAAGIVLPGAADGFAGATLVLTPQSLFAGREALRDMPAVKALRVAAGGEAFDVVRTGNALAVAVRPHVSVVADEPAHFSEAFAQLKRPLEALRLRVLSATAGAPATLAAAPKFDAAAGGAEVDAVDPDRLAAALASIPRQTAILTARIAGGNATVAPAEGPERTIALDKLATAARAADVDLIVLTADPPRQPGGRNWLWQKVAVSGLDHARQRETFADFLDALAAGRGGFLVSVAPDGEGRVTLTAEPAPVPLASGEGVAGWLRQAAGTVAGHVTGAIAPAAVHARLVSDARRRELANRLVPGLPSSAQIVYIASAVLGLMALPVVLSWWRRLWPAEARTEYDSGRGYVLARVVRAVAFVALFLPLAALPAMITRVAMGLARLVRPKGNAAAH